MSEFTINLASSKIVPSFAMAMLRSCNVTCGKRGKSDIAGSVGRPRSGAPTMGTLCAARKSATQTREEKKFCFLFCACQGFFLKSRNWFSCLSSSCEERKGGGHAKSGKEDFCTQRLSTKETRAEWVSAKKEKRFPLHQTRHPKKGKFLHDVVVVALKGKEN